MKMMQLLKQGLTERYFAGRAALWGKLPSHGDYVRHRVNAAQANDWQRWVAETWTPPTNSGRAASKRSFHNTWSPWLDLEPGDEPRFNLSVVPVAFVLPPGTLGFAPNRYVQGVIMLSQDEVGRTYPLIIYQQIAKHWLRRSLTPPLKSKDTANHNLLYWWARLAARSQGADLDWPEFCRCAQALATQFQPGWWQMLSGRWRATHDPAPNCQALLDRFCNNVGLDSASGLLGVRHLPWTTWPEPVLPHGKRVAQNAFWQQDLKGGYINASLEWGALWTPT